MIQPRDRQRLEDIVFYAEKAIHFLGDADAEMLSEQDEKAFAIIRAIEIVGEAAARVSASTTTLAPHLPWAAAKRMRNLLIHAYPETDLAVVVATVRDDFPSLISEVKRLLEDQRL